MSSANVDFVRSIYAAWERGDYGSVEWAHPEIEFVPHGGLLLGSRRGMAEMAEGWRGVLSSWEGFRAEVDEYREVDAKRVLVLDRYHGRGRASGVELGDLLTKGATVFHLRDGKVEQLVVYADRERAFADLGLAPE